MSRFLRQRSFAFALILAVALVIAEVIEQPSFIHTGNWADELGVFAPFAILAMASTPAILSGGGGIDISVGPLAVLVNCVFVSWLLPHGLGGAVSIPIVLAIGLGFGAINGLLVGVLRYQPVIATLCAYFILSGLAEKIAPNSQEAPQNWTTHLAGTVWFFPGALLTVGVPILIWALLKRTPFHRTLLGVGGDDATAYSSGVDVVKVRVAAYAIGGMFAAIGGLALTAQIQSSEASFVSQYALLALAAVALGGTPIGGGRGGMLGSLLGAVCIYMIQQFLSSAGVSTNYLQLFYGALLVIGIMFGARLRSAPRQALA